MSKPILSPDAAPAEARINEVFDKLNINLTAQDFLTLIGQDSEDEEDKEQALSHISDAVEKALDILEATVISIEEIEEFADNNTDFNSRLGQTLALFSKYISREGISPIKKRLLEHSIARNLQSPDSKLTEDIIAKLAVSIQQGLDHGRAHSITTSLRHMGVSIGAEARAHKELVIDEITKEDARLTPMNEANILQDTIIHQIELAKLPPQEAPEGEEDVGQQLVRIDYEHHTGQYRINPDLSSPELIPPGLAKAFAKADEEETLALDIVPEEANWTEQDAERTAALDSPLLSRNDWSTINKPQKEEKGFIAWLKRTFRRN